MDSKLALEIIKKVKPKAGDLFFGSGYGWTNKLVRLLTRFHWSHVAIILEKDGEFWVSESTQGNLSPDYYTKTPKCGIQLVRLIDKMCEYDGDIGLLRLLPSKVEKEINNALFTTYTKYRNCSFANLSTIFYTWYDGPFGTNKEPEYDFDLKAPLSKHAINIRFFCSQWTGFNLKVIQFLGKDFMTNECIPKDFFKLKLQKGCGYRYDDKMIILKAREDWIADRISSNISDDGIDQEIKMLMTYPSDLIMDILKYIPESSQIRYNYGRRKRGNRKRRGKK